MDYGLLFSLWHLGSKRSLIPSLVRSSTVSISRGCWRERLPLHLSLTRFCDYVLSYWSYTLFTQAAHSLVCGHCYRFTKISDFGELSWCTRFQASCNAIKIGAEFSEQKGNVSHAVYLVSQARPFPSRSTDRFQSACRILKAIGAAGRKGSGLRDYCLSNYTLNVQQ